MTDLNKGFTQDIIAVCDKHGLSRKHTAYVLATAYHETAGSMMPIKETVMPWHSDKFPSDITVKRRLDNAFESGKLPWVSNRYWLEGFFGRGFVQLTHRTNYQSAGKKLGVDLVRNPDAALNPTVAAEILVRGMTDGWFTGKKMSDYDNYRDMRRVVNSMDRADDIAALARKYYEVLPERQPKNGSFIAAIVAILTRIFGGGK